jgi:Fe-S oxidoreductase
MQVKVCKACSNEKTLDMFSKGQGKFGKLNTCKVCDSARRRAYHAGLTQEQKLTKAFNQRVRDYKVKYGLSEDQATELAKNRQGTCGICEQERPLVVDHCHDTGAFRGLLCQTCNSLLGYSKDSTRLLENAIKYLSERTAQC